MLKAAYINEIYKISKKKKLIVASILAIGVMLIAAAILLGLDKIAGINVTGSGGFAIIVLPFFMHTLIPLFTAFICIDMFSGEFVTETIKQTLTRPASRFKVFSAKVLASASFVAAFLAFTMIFSVLVSIIIGGDFSDFFDSVKAYISSFVPLFVFALMVIVISNLTRGSASAFLISVVIFVVLKLSEIFIKGSRFFLYTADFDWYNLFIGTPDAFGKILRILLLFVGYGIAFFSAGYYLFDKRSI